MVIRVGTDCSGIEAPIQALIKSKIPFTHEFSSEINKYAIESIKANYSPKRLYGDPDGPFPDGDILNRDNSTLPDIDLYVCGFPCQPFSLAGSRHGIDDMRGTIFWCCIDVIKTKKPAYFILENVKGLLSANEGTTWDLIRKELKKLKNYKVTVFIANTKDYGIPQSRERVYIIGNRVGVDFVVPPIKHMAKLETIIDWSDTDTKESVEIDRHYETIKNKLFVNVCFLGTTDFPNADLYAPCLVARSALWCVPLNRPASVREHLKLQGFSTRFKQVVSDTQIKTQLGNSMSVNVLQAIYRNLF